jgi:hypothetical protein
LIGEKAVAFLRRDAMRRRQPVVVEHDCGLILVAMPWPHSSETRLMAIGAFLNQPALCDSSWERLAADLDIDAEHAARWAGAQQTQSSSSLARMLRLVFDKLTAECKADQLATEVDKLSDHLASTFEAITLIYRLTQNLRGPT